MCLGRNIFDNWKKYLQLANLFTNKKILVITTFLFLMYKLIINNYDNFETVSLTQILRTNICSLTTSFFHEVVSVVVDKQEYILCPWKKLSKKESLKHWWMFGVVLSQLLHAPILMNGHWSHSKTFSWKTCNLKDNNHKKNLNASGWSFDITMEIWGKTWLQHCGGWSCFCFPHSSSQRRTFHFRSSQTKAFRTFPTWYCEEELSRQHCRDRSRQQIDRFLKLRLTAIQMWTGIVIFLWHI